MVEAVANFAQVEMEVFAGHAAVWIQPVLGVAPEALDAVDVIAADRPSLLLADDHMVASQLQRGVGLPLVGVVQRAFAGVRIDLLHDRLAVIAGDGHGLDLAVALDDPEHDDLAQGTPAARAVACATKGGFVALQRACEGLTPLLGRHSRRAAADTSSPPYWRCRSVGNAAE